MTSPDESSDRAREAAAVAGPPILIRVELDVLAFGVGPTPDIELVETE